MFAESGDRVFGALHHSQTQLACQKTDAANCLERKRESAIDEREHCLASIAVLPSRGQCLNTVNLGMPGYATLFLQDRELRTRPRVGIRMQTIELERENAI